MSRVCFATVVSSNHYQFYAPMFVYTAKRAYPDHCVMVFVCGKLKPEVAAIFQAMREKKLVNRHWKVYEDCFAEVPKARASTAALRFLIPPRYFSNYDYALLWDIDFLLFKHKDQHVDQFKRVMKNNAISCAFIRSAIRAPRRPHVTRSGWTGAYTRLIAGMSCVRCADWFTETARARKIYLRCLTNGTHDKFDTHKPGSYREYDEVMLYRICALSGIPVPRKRSHFADGTKFDRLYRDIHLGDFKFSRRRRKGHKKRIVRAVNARAYLKMSREKGWQMVREACSQHSRIKQILRYLDKHVKKMKV